MTSNIQILAVCSIRKGDNGSVEISGELSKRELKKMPGDSIRFAIVPTDTVPAGLASLVTQSGAGRNTCLMFGLASETENPAKQGQRA